MSDVKSKYLTIHLLPTLRALYQMYQHMHWKSAGETYYGDHLLYERLYNDVQGELDQAAEKIIGLYDDEAIGANEDSELASQVLSEFLADDDSPEDYPEIAIKLEKFFIKLISSLMDQLRESDKPTDGLENLAQGFADKHEEHLYLLKQRAKTAGRKSMLAELFKLAMTLDKKAEYELAAEVDAVVAELAQRAGIEDLVALASDLDEQGEVELASQIDKLIEAKTKKNSNTA